jgi:hypothetical protein
LVTVRVAPLIEQPVEVPALKTYAPVPSPPVAVAVAVADCPPVMELGPVTVTVLCEALLSATVKEALSALAR